MNYYLDVFSEDENPSLPIHQMEERQYQQELREGACEDDCEVTCPFIGMQPEESGKEMGSPLNFHRQMASINHEIDQAFALL